MGLAEQMRSHFADHGRLYAVLLAHMADDLDAGGPVAEVVAGRLDPPPEDYVDLRLLAGLYRIILTGRAPELAEFYPSEGGTRPASEVWPVARAVIAGHVDELREALDIAPQTNDVGRSLALVVGLWRAVGTTGLSRVRLLELGASAGLNLNVDRYRFVSDTWRFGPLDATVVIDRCGGEWLEPRTVEIATRRGCDLFPIDAASPEGALRLRSFVWPAEVGRQMRLRHALEVAERHPVTVDRGSADTWLDEQLVTAHEPDVLTVVWHSVSRLYWPTDVVDRVAATIDQARSRMPLVHVAMEVPTAAGGSFDTGEGLPVITVDGQVVAGCGHHGPPLRRV